MINVVETHAVPANNGQVGLACHFCDSMAQRFCTGLYGKSDAAKNNETAGADVYRGFNLVFELLVTYAEHDEIRCLRKLGEISVAGQPLDFVIQRIDRIDLPAKPRHL